MNVVNSELNLKRRIDRFFSSGVQGRKQASVFLNGLAMDAHVYIFGGMLRDISLLGAKGFRSDIDVVFDGNRIQLLASLRLVGVINYKENKFGGFRVRQGDFDFDIWCVEDTWAFKHDLVSQEGVESLLNTTLMNWDAILYHFNDKKFIARDGYLNDLSRGLIDLILEKNPNEAGALVRILRAIYGKNVSVIGERMVDMLRRTLNRNAVDKLIEYEKEHYNDQLINHYKIQCLNEKLSNIKDGEVLDMQTNAMPKQLRFKL